MAFVPYIGAMIGGVCISETFRYFISTPNKNKNTNTLVSNENLFEIKEDETNIRSNNMRGDIPNAPQFSILSEIKNFDRSRLSKSFSDELNAHEYQEETFMDELRRRLREKRTHIQ
jgi:chromosome condensin MukBEF complex kleisin-like MukF subunit